MHAPHYSETCKCRNCNAVRADAARVAAEEEAAERDPLAPCGYCRRCAIHDDPGGCLTVEHYVRKQDGERVAALLNALPLGTEITLGDAGRAYTGTYRKNADGLWDQVWAREAPLVTNFDPAHLGFCVGYPAVQKAVRACPTL